jgi:hypothetical protein
VSPGAWPTANASTALAADRTSAGITVSRLVTRIIGLQRQRERWCNPAVRITSDTVVDGIREQLFDALGSAEKILHANPGSHFRVPSFEIDSSVRFFARHLGSQGAAI